MKVTSSIKAIGAVALMLALAANLALAGLGPPNNPGIMQPKDTFAGKTYAEWAVAWWQWVWAIPLANNPTADTNGQFAALGQSGNVWFLAGTQGGSAERTASVPANKALFFPVVNTIWVNLPDLGDNPWSKDQESYARDLIGASIDTATGVACEIDGVAVKQIAAYRCKTAKGGEFMVQIPEGNIGGLPLQGTYGPSVDDGIYLMLAPLSAGQHTIHFTAALGDGSWSLQVTYHLTVE